MTSPTRTSKDLRSIIITSQTTPDSGDDITNPEALNQLVKDDRTENAMLRSRIEEQGQLICFLKQRADEHLNRIKVLENINNKLQLLHNKSLESQKESENMCQMLERRFNELAENHEEMIKIKDEYKFAVQNLTKENEELKDAIKRKFSAAVEERNAQIEDLKKELTKYERDYITIKDKNSDLQNELNNCEAAKKLKAESMQREIINIEQKLEVTSSELQRLQIENKKRENESCDNMRALKMENKQMLDQVMERGRRLQEKQGEIESMKEEIITKDTYIKKILEEHEKQREAVDANLKVQSLHARNQALEAEISKLKLEFQAFRAHSHNLITQEKNINSQLRNTTMLLR